MQEIERDVSEHGARRIALTDNLINGNPRVFKDLCHILSERKLGITLFGSLAVLPSVDDEMLDLMARAGFVEILLAVETPASGVLRDMGKFVPPQKLDQVVRGSVSRGLEPCIYLMHSFPTESEAQFEELLHFVDDYRPSDFCEVGTWPFRLAQIQPGEIDMDFAERFDIEFLDGYGYDQHTPRVAFGREPRWRSKYVDDGVKLARHFRIMEYLQQWRSAAGEIG